MTEPILDHERLDVYPRIESSTSTALLSTSTNPARNPDEQSDAQSGNGVPIFFLSSRSLAPFSPEDRHRWNRKSHTGRYWTYREWPPIPMRCRIG